MPVWCNPSIITIIPAKTFIVSLKKIPVRKLKLKPMLTKVSESPKINKKVLSTVFFPLLKIPKYTGTMGRIHGDRKLATPPKNTLPTSNGWLNINYLLSCSFYWTNFIKYP